MALERSYARKIADLIAFLVPFLLLAGLAIGGGGYDILARHIAGGLAWILVAILLVGRWPDRIRPGRSFALIGGLLLALALFSAISSIWSSSVASSLTEAERVLGYLGIFSASYLTCRTPKQREWFARGIAAGIGAIAVLAMGDRLIPGGESTGAGFAINRLSYPLGYWNGDGVVFGCGVTLFAWLAATTRDSRLRAAWMALAALSASTLYLTYSRGGILVAVISMLILFFLSSHRLRILAFTVIAIAAAVPILLTIAGYPAISGTGAGDPTTAQSLIVTFVILVSAGLGAAAAEGMVRLASRRPDLTRRPLTVSRDRRTLITIAGTGVLVLAVLIAFYGDSAWNQFSESDVPIATNARDRFTELSGAWRYEFNQVAIETFADHPLLGTGAGTYPIEWNQRRTVPVVTQDAHSFYTQNLSDLGVIGGAITFAFVIALVWLGVIAWRRRLGHDAPAALALTAALLVSFALDWFWRLGSTASLLLLLAAWICSAEAVDPRRSHSAAGSGFRLAGVLAVWFAVVALAVPALADHYMRQSDDSLAAGNLAKAADQARSSSRLDPWSAEPHLQLSAIALSRGQIGRALEEAKKGTDLDPESWRAWYVLYTADKETGDLEDLRRDIAVLKKLNPLYFLPLHIGKPGSTP